MSATAADGSGGTRAPRPRSDVGEGRGGHGHRAANHLAGQPMLTLADEAEPAGRQGLRAAPAGSVADEPDAVSASTTEKDTTGDSRPLGAGADTEEEP